MLLIILTLQCKKLNENKNSKCKNKYKMPFDDSWIERLRCHLLKRRAAGCFDHVTDRFLSHAGCKLSAVCYGLLSVAVLWFIYSCLPHLLCRLVYFPSFFAVGNWVLKY